MLSLYTLLALDVARERAAEARAAAERHRDAELRAAEARAHGLTSASRPSRVRLAAASLLRWVGDRADGLADAACNAAARVEGRAA
jgi:hypothetical protein